MLAPEMRRIIIIIIIVHEIHNKYAEIADQQNGTILKGIRTFLPDIFPWHPPSLTISHPFLHGVAYFPVPPPPFADLQYKAIYR